MNLNYFWRISIFRYNCVISITRRKITDFTFTKNDASCLAHKYIETTTTN